MRKRVLSIFGVFALPVLLFLFFMAITTGFKVSSIPIVISQSMIPTAMGLGMAILMQAELIDFSIGTRVIFCAIIGAAGAKIAGVPGFFAGIIVGAFVSSALIALLYRYLKIPSMVVSMGFVLLAEVLNYLLSGIIGMSGFTTITEEIGKIGAYPYNLIWIAAACVVFYVICYHTKFGNQIRAIGNDEALAISLGIKPDREKLKAYLISGLFCGVGAVLQICFAGSVSVATGMITMSLVFKPMMGVMIALVFIRLWDNMPVLILIGELCLSIVFNGLIALGLTDNYQSIALGVFLLIILGVSRNMEKFKEVRRKALVRKQAELQLQDQKAVCTK